MLPMDTPFIRLKYRISSIPSKKKTPSRWKVLVSTPPEIWTFVGINVFIMLSLITHRYRASNHSELFPSIYQLIALEGVTQMYFTNFLLRVALEVRNMLSVAYFAVAIANVGLTILVVHRKAEETRKPSLDYAEDASQLEDGYLLAYIEKESTSKPKVVSEPVKEIPKAPRRRTTPATKEDRGDSSEDLLTRARQFLEDGER